MVKEKILINIATQKATENINNEYIDLYNDLYKKNNIKTLQIFSGNIDDFNKEYLKKLKDKGIIVKAFKEENLEDFIKNIAYNYEIIFVNTFTEELINIVIKVNKILWKVIPVYENIFRNKNIQRKLIQDYNPEIWVKFLEFNPYNIDLEKIEKFIGYPFILKPSSWIQSAGVSKIENKRDFENYIKNYKEFLKNFQNRWFDNDIIIAEEFIDGEMYSIDYFVDDKQNIFLSKPVKVELANVVGVNDFFNYNRIISQDVEKEFFGYDLDTFIKDTIRGSQIKNFFIHHEFKITSKWKLKTIEINWRIWWYRPGMYFRAYKINLFDFILWKKQDYQLLKNNSVITVYPEKKWILLWFNEEICKKIEKLDSVISFKKIESLIGKEIWLTKDWFWKVWIIKIENENIDTFNKDLENIRKLYKNILILE